MGEFTTESRAEMRATKAEVSITQLVKDLSARPQSWIPCTILKAWVVNGFLDKGFSGEHVDRDELYQELVALIDSPFIQQITSELQRNPEKLDQLRGKHRRTFLLSYLEGLSDQEAASCVSLKVESYQRQKLSLLKLLDS